MQRLTEDRMLLRTNRASSPRLRGVLQKSLLLLVSAAALMLSACGGNSSGGSQQNAQLSGNWQFTQPFDLQGGFLLQTNGSVTGQAVYSISNVQSGQTVVCNSGTATLIQGSITGQTVSLTFMAGSPTNNTTYALTGMLSTSPSGQTTITGDPNNSSSTVTTPSGSAPCGTAQANLSWSAASVPPLAGSITGSFHSGGLPAQNGGFGGEDFPVTGNFTQGPNIGAANATIAGILNFINPTSGLSDYPCVPSGTLFVNGQISGNTVILQLIGSDGSNAGQIGIPLALSGTSGSDGVASVVFDSTTNGYVLHTLPGPASNTFAYVVNTKACPGEGTVSTPGDIGYICLSLNSASACQEPITLSPGSLTFLPQLLGSAPTSQTITLTNNYGADLTGLSLGGFPQNLGTGGVGYSDFTGVPDFTEADTGTGDTCGVSIGQTFDLAKGASCTFTITFDPQESCPWLPTAFPPAKCPLPLPVALSVNNVPSVTHDPTFVVPITGLGQSLIQPSVPELDFGPWGVGEANPQSQMLTLTNTSPTSSVTILQSSSTPCKWSPGQTALPLPLTLSSYQSGVSGLQVVTNGVSYQANGSYNTIYYNCDADQLTNLPNFPIAGTTPNSCIGASGPVTLTPGASCGLQVTFEPQAVTYVNALDYFLELNTLQCSSPLFPGGATSDCELDAGRFPVEIKANPPSPLRMSPSAGLDFEAQPVGTLSNPLTMTLSNDATVANPQMVTFVGTIQASGKFSELDNCPATLAPGSSCTLTVTFKPSAVGFTSGVVTINYLLGGTIAVPQTVYLRGTGQ